MDYKPGDPQKITDTVIALDVAFTALLQAISNHEGTLSRALSEGLDASIGSTPRHLAGVHDMLVTWRAMLPTAPKH